MAPLYVSMKGITHQDVARSCPDCSEETSVVKLGESPPREICGRFGCSWNGVTLRKGDAVTHTNDDGIVVVE